MDDVEVKNDKRPLIVVSVVLVALLLVLLGRLDLGQCPAITPGAIDPEPVRSK